MTDIYDSGKRKKIMSSVRSRGTRLEVAFTEILENLGLEYTSQAVDLPGRPDFVLPATKTAVFVHGCFWHHHRDCSKGTIPKSNSEFWQQKIFDNVRRDRQKAKALEALGWKVVVVWECEIRRRTAREKLLAEITLS